MFRSAGVDKQFPFKCVLVGVYTNIHSHMATQSLSYYLHLAHYPAAPLYLPTCLFPLWLIGRY